VISPRILGCERAYARSHPKMRPSSRQVPENQKMAVWAAESRPNSHFWFFYQCLAQAGAQAFEFARNRAIQHFIADADDETAQDGRVDMECDRLST
jgi:hypothetical protein